MLNRQIQHLERDFLEKGGIRERMTAARRTAVANTSTRSSLSSPSSAETAVQKNCPLCGGAMVLRTARNGKSAGQPFYGCSRYPECCGTSSADEKSN